ncbi:MAG: rod shape-determining protein MreD [Pseudomonadales bacterium]|jgi:rod shape-determining protein MreD
MRQSNSRPIAFSFVSLLLAFILAVIDLPDWMDQWRPSWVLLVVFIWFLVAPNNVGVVVAFFIGLALDLLLGDPLGVNALCLCLVVLICHLQRSRLRIYTELQRALFVVALVVIYQTCYVLLQLIVGNDMSFTIVFAPALTSGIGWLLFSAPVSRLQRQFGVL